MKLKLKGIDVSQQFVIINRETADEMKLGSTNHVQIESKVMKAIILPVICSLSLIDKGYIGVPFDVLSRFKDDDVTEEGEIVDVKSFSTEEGKRIIEKHLKNAPLSEQDIKQTVDFIQSDKFTPLQMSGFVLSQLYKQINIEEVTYLAKHFAKSGNVLDLPGTIFDKHSIGGVPGNKVSLLIVPIIAASGLSIPKTSTKAITSVSGTIDTMTALGCETEFYVEEVEDMIKRSKGCIVSGSKLKVAPAVDKMLSRAAFPLGVDPPSLILAGVLSKKLAMGIQYLVLDVPVGREVKLPDEHAGRKYGRTFVNLASALGITSEVGVTYGSVPVGHAIGPAAEAREGLSALIKPRSGPVSLIEKSCGLAGILLEMAGMSSRGRGIDLAREILYSGKAYSKMKEIIENQGGNPNIKPEDIPLSELKWSYLAPSNGWPVEIRNKALTQIARAAGAPSCLGCGIVLHTKKDSVLKGDKVFTVYASSDSAIEEVRALTMKLKPVVIEGVLIDRVM